MNRILVFSQSGRDVSLPSADSGFAARRHKEPARRGRYPKTAQRKGCARGTNLKFQIGDFREGEMPGVLCRCKHMISRRLRRKRGLFESDAEFHEHKLTQSRRVAESQSRRSQHPILRKCSSWIGSVPSHARREAVDPRIKRSKVGLGGSLSGIKWDYAGQKSAASRLIPDIPGYSRITI